MAFLPGLRRVLETASPGGTCSFPGTPAGAGHRLPRRQALQARCVAGVRRPRRARAWRASWTSRTLNQDPAYRPERKAVVRRATRCCAAETFFEQENDGEEAEAPQDQGRGGISTPHRNRYLRGGLTCWAEE